MAKYDLNFTVAIKYQLPSAKPRRESLDDVKGLDNVTRYIVDSIKREPNIIGWYVVTKIRLINCQKSATCAKLSAKMTRGIRR